MARITIDPEMACEQIALEPDACCEYICFEVGDYSPTFVTDLPDYSGATTVTPSMDAQTLETANTALHDNITVEAIPYDEVEAATPVISVDSGGKVTATTNQQGGIVESSTKSAEYQQPTVEQATPDISVDSDGVITATATQTGGFVAGGSKTATLAQETVEQATPTISVDNAGKITASATQTAGFVAAGTKSVELQQQTVEQATPSISVANDGTVTAEATQTAGFVAAGTKSASYSLPTQAARTVTPSTAAQTAVSAGRWTTGAVEVAAMPTAAQAVPIISMSGGTITATAEQQAGYVEAGIKQAQMSLPTATAATIVPSTVSQQAIGAGVFALGNIGVAPIPSEYIVPSGTLPISTNGTYDVTNYASANVGIPIIETEALTVTENGTYTASSGHAYTPVTVNVAGGGASNLVIGTFTFDTIGANTIAIPYTGNGYPLTVAVYLANGSYNDTGWKNAIHRYSIEQYLMVKTRPDVAPYFGADLSNNEMNTCLRYKNSDTNASLRSAGQTSTYCFGSSNAGTNIGTSVKFKGDVRTLSVFIVGDGSPSNAYGFLTGISYEYMILYSE